MLGDIYPRRNRDQGANANDSLTNSLDWDESNQEEQEQIWQMPAPSSNNSLSAANPAPASFVNEADPITSQYEQFTSTAEEVTDPIRYDLTSRATDLATTAEAAEQMHFGLEATKVSRIQLFQKNIRRWEYIIQVLPFWKSEVITFNITFSILTILGLAVLILVTFADLPTDIPLVYEQLNGSWVLINKSVLVLLLVGMSGFELVLLRLKRIIFNFDRRLSSVMATTQIFINALAIIALVQIISLVLI